MTATFNDRLMAIIRTQNEIAATELPLASTMQLLVERSRELSGATAAAIEMAEDGKLVYRVTCGEATPYLGFEAGVDSGLAGLCVREGKLLRSDDASRDPRVAGDDFRPTDVGSIVCAPLRHEGRSIGVLKVYTGQANGFADDDVETVELMSDLIAAHLSHASLHEVRAGDTRHDTLTGLLNRRAYEERLAIETSRANRYRHALALCLIDLDGFRAVNDLLGHAAGDDVLRRVAAAIDQSRLADDAFRLGGDEFAILMPQTTLDEAKVAARRICEAIDCMGSSGAGVGASFGVAEAGADPADLHTEAQMKLRAAKNELHRRDRRG